MTRRFALVLFLSLAISGAAFADETPAAADAAQSLTVKTFQFKHKDADRAAAIVKPLMSAEGSIAIQPSSNSISVTDRPENLKAIAAALDKFDTAPQAFKLSVRLISAARGEGAARVPDDLKDIAPNLSMLRFNVLESLGAANIDTHEGEPGLVDLNTGYRADFKLGEYDPASNSVQVTDFKVSKAQGDQLTPLLKKTTVNLKLGQTVVIGVGKPEGTRALMIILAAKR